MEKYGFMGLEPYAPKHSLEYLNKACYSHVLGKWVSKEEYLADGDIIHVLPSMFPCHSLKAAKRHLRKHDEIPKGSVWLLKSWYRSEDKILVK